MNRKAASKTRAIVLGTSAVLHALLAVGAILSPKPERSDQVSVAVFEKEKEDEKKKEELDTPPPPPPPPPPPQKQAKAAPAPSEEVAPEPAPAEPAEAPRGLGEQFSGFADLGLVAGPGQGGLAVRTQPSRNQPMAVPGQKETTKKETELIPRAEKRDECQEQIVRAKPTATVNPLYPDAARRSEVEGPVRVQVTVDEQGRVLDVKVLKGLGFGLDEAAIAAVKQWTFAPATRCGKPTSGSVSFNVRFRLGG